MTKPSDSIFISYEKYTENSAIVLLHYEYVPGISKGKIKERTITIYDRFALYLIPSYLQPK